MQYLKNILFQVYQKPSLYLFIFFIIFSVDRFGRWVDFDKGNFPMVYDVDQYYSYLPGKFIKHDLCFKYEHAYWTTHLENGNNIPKVTMGMALLYAPFFTLGHLIASTGEYTTDGYSLPYKAALHFGSILYLFIGLWYCRKSLLKYFSEFVTAITLVCIFFGTNLFYYTYGHGEMPHAYLFSIFSAFIYYVLKWHETQKLKYLLLFSFLAGLATLIRPSECLILLFPLLIHVKSFSELKTRIKHMSFELGFLTFLLACTLFLFPFFLQMLYWKTYTGSWLFFSYGSKEGFFFNDPQITNFLFSFRKGWFVYTPMMIFAVIGIFLLRQKAKGLLLFTIIYLLSTIYLLSSWWDWPFGGSFGCRAMIQSYAFLAFTFAAFIQFTFNLFENTMLRNVVRGLFCIVFVILINLNFTQSWLFKYGIIPSDGMSKEAYLFILSKDKLSDADITELQTKFVPLKREEMMKGVRD